MDLHSSDEDPEEARSEVLVTAYLLTVAEQQGASPLYGKAWMQHVLVAISNPAELRTLLAPSLRARFDYWRQFIEAQTRSNIDPFE